MIKTILTAAVLVGTASLALAAETDPNAYNRYPSYNMTTQGAAPAFQSRNVALTGGQTVISGEQAWLNRASRVSGF